MTELTRVQQAQEKEQEHDLPRVPAPASDAVARADGISTSGPRALESAPLLTRLDQYDPDVSAGIAADAAALIRDLLVQLARVTPEAAKWQDHSEKMTEALNRVTNEKRVLETVTLPRAAAGWDSLAGIAERIEENYNHCYERATAAEAALSELKEYHKNLKANEARVREHYLARLEAAEAALAQMTAERDGLRDQLNNHCACEHNGRGDLTSECQEHQEIREAKDATEAALSAHREALKKLEHEVRETDEGQNVLSWIADRLAALASPQRTDDGHHGQADQ